MSQHQQKHKKPYRTRMSLGSFLADDVRQSLERIRSAAINDNFERKLRLFKKDSEGRSEMGGLIAQLARKAGLEICYINRSNITRAAEVARDYLNFEQEATCLEAATEGAEWMVGYLTDLYGQGIFAVPAVSKQDQQEPSISGTSLGTSENPVSVSEIVPETVPETVLGNQDQSDAQSDAGVSA